MEDLWRYRLDLHSETNEMDSQFVYDCETVESHQDHELWIMCLLHCSWNTAKKNPIMLGGGSNIWLCRNTGGVKGVMCSSRCRHASRASLKAKSSQLPI